MTDKKENGGVISFPLQNKSSKPRMAFGKMLREHRNKAGLDQATIGKACGVTKGAVGNWEHDIARPDVSCVPTLCRLMDMSLYEFFSMKDPNEISNDENALLADYRSLTEVSKRQLRSIMSVIIRGQEEIKRENIKSNYRRLIGHDMGLAAGFGAPVDEEPDAYPVFVRNTRTAGRADDVFPVNGQSMEPDYPDGSMVYVKRVPANELSYGDVIACIVAGTPFVKIYEKDGLHSINPEYSVIEVSDDDNICLIGRVLGKVDPDDMATEEETRELLDVFGEELN